jgi:predicted ester cyclase
MSQVQKAKDFFEKLWQGDSDQDVLQYFTNDAFFETSEGECKGLVEIEKYFRTWETAFPDFQVKVEQLFSSENMVTVIWSATGTQTGPFRRYIPTQQQFYYRGTHIFSFEKDMICEARNKIVVVSEYIDGMDLFVFQ